MVGPGQSADQALLVGKAHFGISEDRRFAAACGRPAATFFEGHGPGQPEGFLLLTSAAMRTPPIAGPHAMLSIATTALKPDGIPVDMDELKGPELVSKAKYVLHHISLRAIQRLSSWTLSNKKRLKPRRADPSR
jgi:hypothetical protein